MAFLFLCSIGIKAQSSLYFVDPGSGNDSNIGDIWSPYRTITKAVSALGSATGTIYLREGVYPQSTKISLTKVGQPGNYIKIWAYNNEKPIVDFTGNSSDGFSISGSYYYLKGIGVKKSGHNGINISGNNNIIENCSVCENGNTGIHLTGSLAPGPSDNLVLNCDSFRNADLPDGGNADGFSAKWTVGPGNIFRGCRAFNNSDDGWDLWMCTGSIIIDSCIAFRNGVDIWGTGISGANGNGIKLGGNYVATPHTVRNCISFDNAGNTGRGFDENNNTAGQTLYNCTAFRNKKDNYHFANDPLSAGNHVIKNCISFQGGVTDNIKNAVMANNSWQGFTVNVNDFASLDTTGIITPRDLNGYLPRKVFLRLTSASSMVNAGIDVGIPFNGSAPDLGAYEYESLTGLGENLPSIKSFELKQIYPNPFSQSTTIVFNLSKPGIVSISLYDITGKTSGMSNNKYSAGGNEIIINGSGMKPGIYILCMKAGEEIVVKKLVLIKQ